VADLRCEYLRDSLGLDATQPRLSWIVESDQRGQRQTAYEVLVASSPERFKQDQGDLWQSGKVISDQTAQVVYAGKPLTSRQACFWKVRAWDREGNASNWSEPARWEMGLLEPGDWKAQWIGADQPPSAAVPMLRKEVKLADKPVAKARLFVTALGLYEIHINGQRVGDHLLAPDWTDYRKRVRYQVYDVDLLLKKGQNTLAALLANGWYCGHVGWAAQIYGKRPALLAQLEVTYTDGSVERIVTDATWKVHASPVLASDFLMGESYDARQEIPDWDQPGLDDSRWAAAAVAVQPPRLLEGQVMEPVQQLSVPPPKSISQPQPGHWVFDLGQNMVGVVRLRVSAPAGTKLTLRHAEMLNPDGTLYTANLRGAKAVDTYICRGGGSVEEWQPRFTFHGFRYVELTGLPSKPSQNALTGVVIGSETPRVGVFSCSNAALKQLQSNILWGQCGNYLSVPTDCPQRDERLGWMGDAQVFVRTATQNADVAAFFSKWLVDVDDGQSADGAFSDVSPDVLNFRGVPAWGDAGVICPWTIYQVYGDTRILERHLPAMTRWVQWCRKHSTNLIRDKDRGNDYGDWLAIGAATPKDLIGTAYFAYSTSLVAKSYEALGKHEEAAKYRQLFADIKAAFNKRYVAADGRIAGNTQCCYAMALKFDLLPDALRPKAAQYLEDDLRAKGWHLSTGFVGVSYLLPVLTQAGKPDAAYLLLLQDTFPSWLFSVKHGATTIWERWDGWTPEKGFQDYRMNSFSHYSFGAVARWMFQTVAGIDTAQPGFQRLLIRPQPAAGLSWVKAEYHSIHGPVATQWRAERGKLSVTVVIPANTTATVCLPAADAAAVSEGGRPVAEAEAVKVLPADGGQARLQIAAGEYRFTMPWKGSPE
jgi:alpha-L-rhamnosidase